MKFIYSLIFFVALATLACKAQRGCFVRNPSRIFYIDSPGSFDPPGSPLNLPYYITPLALDNSGACPRVKTFGQNSIGDCYIRTGTVNNYTYTPGLLYTYTVENCPIDDYIPLLILVTAGLGFFCLRKTLMSSLD